MIGTTRIMVAASLDRAMPEWFSRVHERLHTPVNAHLAFMLCSIPAILCYNLVPGWIALDPGCHLRRRPRLYRQRPGRDLLPVQGQGSLCGFTGREVQGQLLPWDALGVGRRLRLDLGCLGDGSTCLPGLPLPDHVGQNGRASSVSLRSCGRSASSCRVGSGARRCPGRPPSVCWAAVSAWRWCCPSCSSPALGVLGNWDFTEFPTHLWSQILAFGIIVFCIVWYAWTKRSQKVQGYQHRLRLQGDPARVKCFESNIVP